MAVPSTASTPSGTPTIKRSHSEVGSDEDMGGVPLALKRFASKIVDVYVGDKRFHYPVHEAFLFQSKELKAQYDAQNRGKKGNKKKENLLNLPRDTVNGFGQLLEYLYLNKLTLNASEPQAQADELLTVWTTGSKHSLLGMQSHVIRKLEELDLAGKLPALSFLRLTDHLYESEVDNGLRRYFESVAANVVRKITSTDMPILLDMITEGGSFASDLFNAYHRAFGPDKSASAAEQRATTSIKTEDSKQQRAAKRARTDNGDTRTEWDNANNIPEALETASTADKLLVRWVEDLKPWEDIAEAWENATGERVGIEDLMHRYQRIDANVLRLDKRDSDLLAAAKSAVEAKFNTDKWPVIAAKVAENGGSEFNPIRLQRYCDALDAAKVKAKGHEEVYDNGPQQQPLRPGPKRSVGDDSQIPTEVVGGVRVENSKPLDVRPRRRGPPKTPAATKAGNATAKKAKASRDVESSDNDTEMAEREPMTREASTLFVGNDDEKGGVETGVKVTYEGGGANIHSKMRHDQEVADEKDIANGVEAE